MIDFFLFFCVSFKLFHQLFTKEESSSLRLCASLAALVFVGNDVRVAIGKQQATTTQEVKRFSSGGD